MKNWQQWSLVAAFAILVVTVGWLGWQIEKSIEHTERTACVQFSAQEAFVSAVALTDPDLSEADKALLLKVVEESDARLQAQCGEILP